MNTTPETLVSTPFNLSASPAPEHLAMRPADNPLTVDAAVGAIQSSPSNAQHLASPLAPMGTSLNGALPNPTNEADAPDGALLPPVSD